MSWAVGYDDNWRRDIGYGVPAECDHPKCHARIDRGLAYVCGGQPYGGDKGCGLYFCPEHQRDEYQRCPRCSQYKPPYAHPKPDLSEWMRHKLTDESWQEWRDGNPGEVEELARQLAAEVSA
jgi:hypothetical protein